MRTVSVPLKNGDSMIVDVLSVNEYLLGEDIKQLSKKFTKKRGWTPDGKPNYYLNVPVTFDIETSHYDVDNDVKKRVTFMYIWQASVNGVVIMGRTWNDFSRLLLGIRKEININEKRRMIIFIQNLPYEYQFMHKRFPIESVFAREARKPISVKLDGMFEGIELRCTYALSGSSLSKIAEDTLSCPISKMTGDLDYDKLRTKTTILSDKELIYCVNDVLVLHYYILDLINNEYTKSISEIPLTKTGFVRRDARNSFARDKEYRKFYNNQKLNAHQFMMYYRAYRGGDTHAQALWCGEKINNVFSFDLTSSYPYRIVAEQFPLSKPITINNPTIEHINYLDTNKMLYIIDCNLINLKYKGIGYHTYLPREKCLGESNLKQENGRVISADAVRVCMTSIDFELISKYYDFELGKIYSIVFHYKKGLLPLSFRKFTIELYKKKTTLKGIVGKEIEYLQSKERVNSLYGMCVTNPLNDEIEHKHETGEWVKNVLHIKESNLELIQMELDKVYKSRNHFMAYEVGVWISAWARYDLHQALSKLGTDAVYWDTDSCKFINKENYDLFKKLNMEKEIKLLSLGYEENDISPMDIKGKRHTIGLWDEEYPNGVTFKTFGSKKYFYVENGVNHITVAGLSKKKACLYLSEKLNGDVTNIELGETIDEEHSGRTYSIYNDEGFELEINGETICEKSFISIVPTTYVLGDTEEHKLFIILSKNMKKQERGNL